MSAQSDQSPGGVGQGAPSDPLRFTNFLRAHRLFCQEAGNSFLLVESRLGDRCFLKIFSILKTKQQQQQQTMAGLQNGSDAAPLPSAKPENSEGPGQSQPEAASHPEESHVVYEDSDTLTAWRLKSGPPDRQGTFLKASDLPCIVSNVGGISESIDKEERKSIIKMIRNQLHQHDCLRNPSLPGSPLVTLPDACTLHYLRQEILNKEHEKHESRTSKDSHQQPSSSSSSSSSSFASAAAAAPPPATQIFLSASPAAAAPPNLSANRVQAALPPRPLAPRDSSEHAPLPDTKSVPLTLHDPIDSYLSAHCQDCQQLEQEQPPPSPSAAENSEPVAAAATAGQAQQRKQTDPDRVKQADQQAQDTAIFVAEFALSSPSDPFHATSPQQLLAVPNLSAPPSCSSSSSLIGCISALQVPGPPVVLRTRVSAERDSGREKAVLSGQEKRQRTDNRGGITNATGPSGGAQGYLGEGGASGRRQANGGWGLRDVSIQQRGREHVGGEEEEEQEDMGTSWEEIRREALELAALEMSLTIEYFDEKTFEIVGRELPPRMLSPDPERERETEREGGVGGGRQGGMSSGIEEHRDASGMDVDAVGGVEEEAVAGAMGQKGEREEGEDRAVSGEGEEQEGEGADDREGDVEMEDIQKEEDGENKDREGGEVEGHVQREKGGGDPPEGVIENGETEQVAYEGLVASPDWPLLPPHDRAQFLLGHCGSLEGVSMPSLPLPAGPRGRVGRRGAVHSALLCLNRHEWEPEDATLFLRALNFGLSPEEN
uniref:Uncharacterized protein n=1 Tax=Chromera velia CCMP2878 TaxID=1169474 RepID=A0A0G4HUA2_9ALVE|eukprot:Cvel_8606.t1-p1 / transcript=Cvel_8606.t1 / gene=Cvel_8606 / organism=Chromera_velia_CCMP2878 / gene_product=hypothetical protein / transcript_product=hypothetical protein / location=Cvel_scaffold478:7016-11979(-) / protein_length=771 / sequence_SO=supercontig / SO=protein_coding / is_pseudo=false